MFSVTFERWDEESAEIGETDDRGFVVQDVSLRDAIQNGLEYSRPKWAGYCEADSCPVSISNPPRWLSFPNWNDGTAEKYQDGIEESRSLHFPKSITPSSAMRIARLFDCYGIRD